MNYFNQFWPWISETPEQLKQKQLQEENDTKRKLEEEKYSQEFNNSIKNNILNILNNLDSNLINNEEKNTIISKLEANYINNKIKWLDFEENNELIKIIKTMSFEAAWDISKKEFLENNNKIRKELIKKIENSKVSQNEIEEYFDKLNNEKLQEDNILKNIDSNEYKNTWIEQIQNNEKLNNNPIFPTIERIYEQWEINETTFKEIKNQLNTSEKLEIDKLNIDLKEKKILEWYMTNLDFNNLNREQNLNKLTQDIKESPEIKNLEIKINKDWTFENEALNKVGKNYLKIPDSNWNFDIQKDFSTAIKTTKNEILKEVKNIKKDSETYKQAIKNINSWNLKKQLEWINSLYILAYSNEWILGKKSLDKYKNNRKKQLIEEAKKLEQTLQQQKLNEQQTKQLEKRKEEIKKELSEITGIKNWKKIEGWDIFKATKKESNDNWQIEKEQTI